MMETEETGGEGDSGWSGIRYKSIMLPFAVRHHQLVRFPLGGPDYLAGLVIDCRAPQVLAELREEGWLRVGRLCCSWMD